MKKIKVSRTLIIVVVVVVVLVIYSQFSAGKKEYHHVDTSVLLQQLDKRNVASAVIDDSSQSVSLTLKKPFEKWNKIESTYPLGASEQIFESLQKTQANSWNTQVNQRSLLGTLLQYSSAFITVFFIAMLLLSLGRGGKGGLFGGFGKSKAKKITKEESKTRFSDVKGIDEVVSELAEIKDYFQFRDNYIRIGAKIPKGVLLSGPPGTGKTLLARAVAGEAGIPFIYTSGSDFEEMFAGVGAARVRDLFEQARQSAPCVVFIDELDAVGKKRGIGSSGIQEERDQTLNQLLVEMDGFKERDEIIVIAATNRSDVLDDALLRPGRFDRHIQIPMPSLYGRHEILKVHAKNKSFEPGIRIVELAQITTGMSGAELENILNESALLAVRHHKNAIGWPELIEATDRVNLGPENRSKILTDHDKKLAAYHEAGHVIAAWLTPGSPPLSKVTIVQRGQTGGHTAFFQEDDQLGKSRTQLVAEIITILGGRVAEEIVFDEPSTGAMGDIVQATRIARMMVTEFGMSSKLGFVRYGAQENSALFGSPPEYSPTTAERIDQEIYRIIDTAHNETWSLLSQNRDLLEDLTYKLLVQETLRKDELEEILHTHSKRERLDFMDDHQGRYPSSQGAMELPATISSKQTTKTVADLESEFFNISPAPVSQPQPLSKP